MGELKGQKFKKKKKKDRSLYSHSSGGQKSEIKVWAGPPSL